MSKQPFTTVTCLLLIVGAILLMIEAILPGMVAGLIGCACIARLPGAQPPELRGSGPANPTATTVDEPMIDLDDRIAHLARLPQLLFANHT